MNAYIVKVRVSEFVWVPNQVLADSVNQPLERAVEQLLAERGGQDALRYSADQARA